MKVFLKRLEVMWKVLTEKEFVFLYPKWEKKKVEIVSHSTPINSVIMVKTALDFCEEDLEDAQLMDENAMTAIEIINQYK